MGSQRFPLSVSAAQALTRFVTVFSLKKAGHSRKSMPASYLFYSISFKNASAFQNFFLKFNIICGRIEIEPF